MSPKRQVQAIGLPSRLSTACCPEIPEGIAALAHNIKVLLRLLGGEKQPNRAPLDNF